MVISCGGDPEDGALTFVHEDGIIRMGR